MIKIIGKEARPEMIATFPGMKGVRFEVNEYSTSLLIQIKDHLKNELSSVHIRTEECHHTITEKPQYQARSLQVRYYETRGETRKVGASKGFRIYGNIRTKQVRDLIIEALQNFKYSKDEK